MKKIVQVVFFSILLSPVVYGQPSPADLILVNGKVFTGDAAKPSAEAIAIRGERIIAVGTSADIEVLAGATTRKIDLQGHVATPGFNDAHFHFGPDPNGARQAGFVYFHQYYVPRPLMRSVRLHTPEVVRIEKGHTEGLDPSVTEYFTN